MSNFMPINSTTEMKWINSLKDKNYYSSFKIAQIILYLLKKFNLLLKTLSQREPQTHMTLLVNCPKHLRKIIISILYKTFQKTEKVGNTSQLFLGVLIPKSHEDITGKK